MPGDADVTLTATAPDGWSATVRIAPHAGGRIRRIAVVDPSGSEVDVLAPVPVDAPIDTTGWGSFPMAPWAGRIRHGRFRWLDRDVRLDTNNQDGDPTSATAEQRRHAIHGTTFSRPWTVVDHDSDHVEMTCPLVGALGWPYPGTARQRVTLTARRLECELAVEPEPGQVFPATIGWHPWFPKPDRLEFAPLAMYERDGIGLPTGTLVVPSDPPWDDCFIVHEPVRLHYDRAVAPVVSISSIDCDHWVIYDMPIATTCVEPQSGPPDAANLRPLVVTSERPVRRTMTIAW